MAGYGADAGAGKDAEQAGEDVILLKKYCLAVLPCLALWRFINDG